MKKVDFADYDKCGYTPGASFVKRTLWLIVNAVFFQNPLSIFSSVKVSLLKAFGCRAGKHITIKPSVSIKYPWRLEMGDYTSIGESVWIDNLAPVRIGSNVCISQGAYLLTGSHNYKSVRFDLITGSITLEDGVWIGAKAIVCPGVTCRSHSVLAVNSVANKDLEAYSIYQGNPATLKRTRELDG